MRPWLPDRLEKQAMHGESKLKIWDGGVDSEIATSGKMMADKIDDGCMYV